MRSFARSLVIILLAGCANQTPAQPPSVASFLSLEAGAFWMGSPPADQCRWPNETQHRVSLSRAFEIGVTEVTQEQFQSLLSYNPASFGPAGKGRPCDGACPVESVSWHDAAYYCNALSKLKGFAPCYQFRRGNAVNVRNCQQQAECKEVCVNTHCVPWQCETDLECIYATCKDNADCNADEKCREGRCVKACTQDAECRKSPTDSSICRNQICVSRLCTEQICVDWRCRTDLDCITSSCSTTTECGDGEECREGRCVKPCTREADCGDKATCRNQICVSSLCDSPSCRPLCREDQDCSGDNWCKNNMCVAKPASCSENADCPLPDQQCIDHTCSQCSQDADCQKECIEGICLTPCTTEPSCRGRRTCCNQPGLCIENTCAISCAHDTDCLQDEACIKNTCAHFVESDVEQTDSRWIDQCSGYRLPTEAEWEYAYRAGRRGDFYHGSILSCQGADPHADQIGWYKSNAGQRPHPVGHKQPNDFGLFDMAGNVKEWCQDIYTYDLGAQDQLDPLDDLIRQENFPRVIRGGGWADEPGGLRGASREGLRPTDRGASLGFRCVRTLSR